MLISGTGAKDFQMDYKNALGPGCACAMGLGKGKRENDEEEYGMVVGKVMRKNICYSQKLAMMGRYIAVGPVFARNLQNCH